VNGEVAAPWATEFNVYVNGPTPPTNVTTAIPLVPA